MGHWQMGRNTRRFRKKMNSTHIAANKNHTSKIFKSESSFGKNNYLAANCNKIHKLKIL